MLAANPINIRFMAAAPHSLRVASDYTLGHVSGLCHGGNNWKQSTCNEDPTRILLLVKIDEFVALQKDSSAVN